MSQPSIYLTMQQLSHSALPQRLSSSPIFCFLLYLPLFSCSHFLPYQHFRDAIEGEFPRAISLFRTSQSYIAQARESVPDILSMVWFGQYAPGRSYLLSLHLECIRLKFKVRTCSVFLDVLLFYQLFHPSIVHLLPFTSLASSHLSLSFA